MATAARKTNWFAIWTTIIVAVIVVGVGAAVVIANNISNSPGQAPSAASVDAKTGAVRVGEADAKDTVATYIDFMCPICNQFEGVYGAQLKELAQKGDIALDLHPVAILDSQSMGTNYSTRAANAFYCVADTAESAVLPFMSTLFTNQPSEGTAGLTDEQLIQYAKDAGADIATCQTGKKYEKFVTAMTKQMPADPTTGRRGTPTIVINGKYTSLSDIGASQTYFTDKFGSSTGSTEAPTPTPSAPAAK
ncbi:DsbA family protein [Microbacterium gorillae]|uniref:DsbA family protein n=1 Tax=Microbacterium gorillae TaxID=1231063 RepID=UPI0006948C22|nr:DsbA family protein [Microbacterium gorillae]